MAEGLKTFVAGEKLRAADVNDYLMSQTVMRFDDSTARDTALSSPAQGMVAFLKDVNALTYYDGSGWMTFFLEGYTSYTPSITSTNINPSYGTGVTRTGGYRRYGNVVEGWAMVVWGGSGLSAGSGAYQYSLPVSADMDHEFAPIGQLTHRDSSAFATYPRSLILWNASYARALSDSGVTTSASAPVAPETGDIHYWTFKYIAA